jgi:hypothetical protein
LPSPSVPEWMLPFTPHEHDVRISRNRWVFYVRGVKVGEPFRGDATWDGTLVGLVMTPIIKGVAALFWSRMTTWKVGILRYKDRKLGGRIRIVHKETLPPGQEPYERIAALVRAVNDGSFDT